MNRFFSGPSARFFWVNVLACVGMNVGVVGVNWFIIDATRQNTVLGLYGAVSLLSAFLTLAFCAEITDRLPKMALLGGCCIGQAGLFFLTALACWMQLPALWIIYALAVLNMPLMVVFSIVSRGAVADVWAQDKLSRGNAVIEITLQTGAMCAALLTGFLYHTIGFGSLIALGGALTLAGGVLAFVSRAHTHAVQTVRENYWKELYKGWGYLCAHRRAAIIGFAAFVPTVIISVSNTVIPGYVEQTLAQNALVYGLSDLCFAVGALLAGLWGGARWASAKAVFGGFLLVSAGLVGLVANRSVFLFYVVIFGVGFCLAKLRIVLNTFFMQTVDNAYLGRCLSLLMALAMLVQAALAYGVGKLMDVYCPPAGYVVLAALAVGGMTAIIGLYPARTKK